jgi:hypothetical protein
VEPLFELVKENRDFGPPFTADGKAQFRQATGSGSEVRASFAESGEQLAFGGVGGCFEIDWRQFFRELRQQTGFDKRGFPAAAGAINQPHGERLSFRWLLNAAFPEVDAVGESIEIALSREQIEEVVGIAFVKGTQAFGFDDSV